MTRMESRWSTIAPLRAMSLGSIAPPVAPRKSPQLAAAPPAQSGSFFGPPPPANYIVTNPFLENFTSSGIAFSCCSMVDNMEMLFYQPSHTDQ